MQKRIIIAALVAGASVSIVSSAKSYIPVGEPIVGITTSLCDVEHSKIIAALRRATYSDEDIDTLRRIVEAEATDGDLESKENVASAIINRVDSDDFPDTVVDVVFQRCGGSQQFLPVSDKRFYKVKVTETTIEAVDYVMENGPVHDGLHFNNPKGVTSKSTRNWFDSLQFVLKDSINHYYYK